MSLLRKITTMMRILLQKNNEKGVVKKNLTAIQN